MILYVTWVQSREQPCYVENLESRFKGLNVEMVKIDVMKLVVPPPPIIFGDISQSGQFNPAKLKAIEKFTMFPLSEMVGRGEMVAPTI